MTAHALVLGTLFKAPEAGSGGAMTPLESALAYAAAGVAVIPCEPASKEPVWSLVPKEIGPDRKPVPRTGGIRKATRDPATITEWWTMRPDAMVMEHWFDAGFDGLGDPWSRALRPRSHAATARPPASARSPSPPLPRLGADDRAIATTLGISRGDVETHFFRVPSAWCLVSPGREDS